MIDIGANLSNKNFNNDLGNILKNAKESNIKNIILTTTNQHNFQDNLKIIETYGHIIQLHTTLGLHPHYANEHIEFFNSFKKHINNHNIVAIGEFGLDFFRMLATKSNQIITMEKFLEAATLHKNKPLFLHERGAFNEFYSILKNSTHLNKSIVHCFTGDKNQAKKYLDLGCYIGITGWITDSKRNKNLLEFLPFLPLDRLMIETDSPYLTPKITNTLPARNEPANLIHIAQFISNNLNIPINTIIETTMKNSIDFFELNDIIK